MFDMRLGLALSKTVGEIHAMPYVEWKNWQTFYLLEPWGWLNEEVNTARIVTMQHNSHAKKSKEPKDFIRDMAKELLKALEDTIPIKAETEEERHEKLIARVKKDLNIK